MKTYLMISILSMLASQGAVAADQPKETSAPRGGICYAQNPFRDNVPLTCPFIGRVKNVNEIYEKGFRVVTAGIVPKDSGMDVPAGMFIVIEERK